MSGKVFLLATCLLAAGCASNNVTQTGVVTDATMNTVTILTGSNQTMSLAGTVYAADTSCEVGAQNLYNVIISINDGSAKITQLVVDEDSLTNGGTPVVYGLLSDGKLSKLDNAKDLTFTPELTTGTWATGSVTITLKADPAITDQVTVA